MFLGRAGVIGYYAKKSRDNASKKREHFLGPLALFIINNLYLKK